MTVQEFLSINPWEVVQMYASDTQNALFDEEDLHPIFDEVLENLDLKED